MTLEGSRIKILWTSLHYICFIQVLYGVRWVIMGCYSESARGTKKNTDLNIPQIKTITTFRTTSNPFQHEVCQNTIAQKIPKLQIHCSNNINVVQLLTYGPFYKNAATRGPLPIEWCNLYNNGFPTVQIKKEKTSECVTESVWVFETIANSNIITNLSVGCLWPRFLCHDRTVFRLPLDFCF